MSHRNEPRPVMRSIFKLAGGDANDPVPIADVAIDTGLSAAHVREIAEGIKLYLALSGDSIALTAAGAAQIRSEDERSSGPHFGNERG